MVTLKRKNILVDITTHQEIRELAEWLGTTTGLTVALEVRCSGQITGDAP